MADLFKVSIASRWDVRSRLIAALLVVMVLFAGSALYRNKATGMWAHPDQDIPVKVMQGMHQRGDLDTDWAKADLPSYFRACRYNFSGYILFSYAATRIVKPVAFHEEQMLGKQLQRFSRFFSTLTLALVFILLARNLGVLYGIGGAIAVASVPQLFQDAHYARPEALATFLFTLCFAISSLRPRTLVQRMLSVTALSVLAGFLASIKITFAVVALFIVPIALSCLAEARRNHSLGRILAGLTALLGVGMAVGFALGAPAAIADPQGFLAGLAALREQYSGVHPPHGHMEHGILAQGKAMLLYYLATLSPITLGLHAVGYRGRPLTPAKYAYAVILVVTLAGFLVQEVFFERNFSPLVPAFVVIAMCGLANVAAMLTNQLNKHRKHSIAIATLCSGLFVASQSVPLSITRNLSTFFSREDLVKERGGRQKWLDAAQKRVGTPPIVFIPYFDVVNRKWPLGEGCKLYAVDMFGDDWSARFLRELPVHYRIVDVNPSAFVNIPISTLHTYHSPNVNLFIDTDQCPRGDTVIAGTSPRETSTSL